MTKIHREDTGRYLHRLAADCAFGTLADLHREALERWLARRTADGMSARTRNAYRNALVAFCNWCVETNRLAVNPFDAVPKANEKADPRRQRRAMTEAELVKLLAVARERPLLEALTVRKGPRKGERYADVRPEVRERLDLLGRERALIYKTLVLTGLRKGELASLTVAQPAPRRSRAVRVARRRRRKEPRRERHRLAGRPRRGPARLARRQAAPAASRSPGDSARRSRPGCRPTRPLFDVPTGLVQDSRPRPVLAGIAR